MSSTNNELLISPTLNEVISVNTENQIEDSSSLDIVDVVNDETPSKEEPSVVIDVKENKPFKLKNFKERVKFYLGEKLKNRKVVKNASKYKNIWTINDLTEGKNRFDKVYDKPLKELLTITKNTDKKFIFRRADIMSIKEQNSLTLCKNRCDGNKSSVLLKCLNFKRHWELYYNRPKDIPFEEKSNKVFWRGTTTGCSADWQSKQWEPRKVNRFKLIKKWFNKNENFDIGFSQIHRDWLKKKIQ